MASIRQDPITPGRRSTYREADTGRFASRQTAAEAALADLVELASRMPTRAEIRVHSAACALSGRPCIARPRRTVAQRRAAKTAAALFG